MVYLLVTGYLLVYLHRCCTPVYHNKKSVCLLLKLGIPEDYLGILGLKVLKPKYLEQENYRLSMRVGLWGVLKETNSVVK